MSGQKLGADLGARIILQDLKIDGDRTVVRVPRARGEAALCVKRTGHRSAIDDLRMSGCLKVLFPRCASRLDTILVNTAGGLTGGDRLSIDVTQAPDTAVSITTQAAERIYRARESHAVVKSRITVAERGTLFWLPQELILFEGAALERHFHCALADEARLLMVEPIVFGRKLMGEELRQVRFRDRVSIDRGGQPLYRDVIDLSSDTAARLDALTGCAGAGAMATLCYVAPDAEIWVDRCRTALGPTGGASLIAPDFLLARLVAPDSMSLRRSLMDLLDQMTGDTLPASWRL